MTQIVVNPEILDGTPDYAKPTRLSVSACVGTARQGMSKAEIIGNCPA